MLILLVLAELLRNMGMLMEEPAFMDSSKHNIAQQLEGQDASCMFELHMCNSRHPDVGPTFVCFSISQDWFL